MREYYNASRIIVTLHDDFTGELYKQEMNHNTKPFTSQENADDCTCREIREWIKSKGERMYDTILTFVCWRKY